MADVTVKVEDPLGVVIETIKVAEEEEVVMEINLPNLLFKVVEATKVILKIVKERKSTIKLEHQDSLDKDVEAIEVDRKVVEGEKNLIDFTSQNPLGKDVIAATHVIPKIVAIGKNLMEDKDPLNQDVEIIEVDSQVIVEEESNIMEVNIDNPWGKEILEALVPKIVEGKITVEIGEQKDHLGQDVEVIQVDTIEQESNVMEITIPNPLGKDALEAVEVIPKTAEEGRNLMEVANQDPLDQDIEITEVDSEVVDQKQGAIMLSFRQIVNECVERCFEFQVPSVPRTQPSLKVKNLIVKENSNTLLIRNILSTRNCGECFKNMSELENYWSWAVMEFCSILCLEKYQRRNGLNCINCKAEIYFISLGKYCARIGNTVHQFCGNSCLQEYKQNIHHCDYCQNILSVDGDNGFLAKIDNKNFQRFCTQFCMNQYTIIRNKQIGSKLLGLCVVCNGIKSIIITFEHQNRTKIFCSDSCFNSFKFANDIVTGACDSCQKQCHSTILENNSMYYKNTHHFFCSINCKNYYINSSKIITTCEKCKINKYSFDMIQHKIGERNITVCSLICLSILPKGLKTRRCRYCGKYWKKLGKIDPNQSDLCSIECDVNFHIKMVQEQRRRDTATQKRNLGVIMRSPIPLQRNAGTMCKVASRDQIVHCKPITADKSIQTDNVEEKVAIVPIPVPIYVPVPMCKYALPIPMFFPFPLPIPVPIFIATTGKTASGIIKELEDIKEKIPADPLEAELIVMAEMVAEPIQASLTEIIEDKCGEEPDDVPRKELDKPTIVLEDLESILSASTLRGTKEEIPTPIRTKRSRDSQNVSNKKQKLDIPEAIPKPSPTHAPTEETESQVCLKYMLGIAAWKQWITFKIHKLEEFPHQAKMFKKEILQLTVKELNHFLCLFIKEIRKPNGLEYSPDTIYYLCLCIQMYLFKNGRTDDIFFDTFYEEFTDSLDEVAKKFSLLYNDSEFIVTRVREEHLWESHQLGAHNPYVLLNTIMFFNMKYLNLGTIVEHSQLSFLKVMRHWKRTFGQVPVQKASNSDNKIPEKAPMMEENATNPVKLYEFYLSKCPDSVKNHTDVFYLQPERHCTPDSPVWFSTTPVPKYSLEKMFHRIKFVKEINVALLYN